MRDIHWPRNWFCQKPPRYALASHNMPEVMEVADRVEVLRLGQRVATFKRGEATMEDLVGAMTGALVQS